MQLIDLRLFSSFLFSSCVENEEDNEEERRVLSLQQSPPSSRLSSSSSSPTSRSPTPNSSTSSSSSSSFSSSPLSDLIQLERKRTGEEEIEREQRRGECSSSFRDTPFSKASSSESSTQHHQEEKTDEDKEKSLKGFFSPSLDRHQHPRRKRAKRMNWNMLLGEEEGEDLLLEEEEEEEEEDEEDEEYQQGDEKTKTRKKTKKKESPLARGKSNKRRDSLRDLERSGLLAQLSRKVTLGVKVPGVAFHKGMQSWAATWKDANGK